MELKKQLLDLFKKLNDEIGFYNRKCFDQGSLTLPKQTLKLVGQIALLISDLPFEILATRDLDYVGQIDYVVRQKLQQLLQKMNLHLETDTQLIWMPSHTLYLPFYVGAFLTVLVAHPRDVLRAKEKFNRPKDKPIIAALKNHFGNKNE
jgi:hypothetical protein